MIVLDSDHDSIEVVEIDREKFITREIPYEKYGLVYRNIIHKPGI